jgi:arylsulfatase A-like enzyme
MHPNIIFFLIDGLRADQVYGNNRTGKTPNFDSLIQNGMYFEQAITSADGTIISLNTIFNSNFQVAHAARYQKIVLNENNLIDVLKKNGYHIYGIFPNLTSFNSLRQYFENEKNSYDWIEPNIPSISLPTGLATKIIQLLESKEKQEPYFCYFHIFDLHPLREGKKPIGIEEFDNEKFGSSMYAKTVSSIDHWLGNILKKIDLEKTLLVITSDHGERIPFENKSHLDFQPRFDSAVKAGRKYLPRSFHKVGGKFSGKVKDTIGRVKQSSSNVGLTSYQKRSRDTYFTLSLYDELIRVPLLFVGTSIKPRIITKQVRHIDIFPTIFELIDIPLDIKISGKSLVSATNEISEEEEPNYLHTMPYQKLSPLDRVGIRTSKYKYFRVSRDSKKNVNLYDLKNDPYENNNITQTHKQLVARFENKILKLQKDNLSEYEEKISDKEMQRISNELKRLGYIKD